MAKFSKTEIFSLVKWLAEHAFWSFLFLFFISLILGGTMFYKYVTLAQQTEPEPEVAPVRFREDFYQDILKEWQAREEKFEYAGQKEYPDPFWIVVD